MVVGRGRSTGDTSMDNTVTAALVMAGGSVLAAIVAKLSLRKPSAPPLPRASDSARPVSAGGTTADPERVPNSGGVEGALRQHRLVRPRLSHARDSACAEAAVLFYCRNVPPPVEQWPQARTWQFVAEAYRELTEPGRARGGPDHAANAS
jgi:hypothetical protein